MLTAGAAASVGVNPKVILVNLHVHVLLDVRHHVQRYKRSLPFALRVKGGNPHQSVDALFRLQIAVGIGSVYLKGHRLDAGLVAIQIIQHLHAKALALCPSGIHAVKHGTPVAALRAACPRVQLEDGIMGVIFPGKQRTYPDILKGADKIIQLRPDICRKTFVLLLVPHLNQGFNILILPLKALDTFHCIL